MDTIPNGDFEYWQTATGPFFCTNYCLDVPDNWCTTCSGVWNRGIFKDTNSYSGNYAIRGLEHGMVYVSSSNSKFAVSNHYKHLNCYIKTDSPDVNDTLLIKIVLYNNSNPIDSGQWIGTLLPTVYSPISIPISQTNPSADSAYVYIQIGGLWFINHFGSNIWVDNLSLDTVSTGIEENNFSNSLSLSPNPATTSLQLAINNWQGEKMEMEIFDVMGKKVIGEQLPVGGKTHIDISFLEKGVYYLKVFSKGNSDSYRYAVKKFVKI